MFLIWFISEDAEEKNTAAISDVFMREEDLASEKVLGNHLDLVGICGTWIERVNLVCGVAHLLQTTWKLMSGRR